MNNYQETRQPPLNHRLKFRWTPRDIPASFLLVSTHSNKSSQRRKDDINLAELKPEDFKPVSREALGANLVRLAKQPKKKK